MKKDTVSRARKTAVRRPALLWVLGWLALCAAAVLLVYFWRVFYSFDRVSPALLTLLTVLGVSVLYAAVPLTLHFVPTLAGRAAVFLALCGLCMSFASPPMQVPDEAQHYLRSYAISMGRFDFDAQRGYPRDVDLLLKSFPGAYTNSNDGAPVKQYCELADPKDPNGVKLPVGRVRSVADCFAQYRAGMQHLEAGEEIDAPKITEPLVVMLLPYFPQALGMAAARLFGGGALACLYAGRIANLACYVLLAWAALRLLKRWQGIFLAVLFLPLSLYMAASLSYDAQLLGLYALAAALLLQEEVTDRSLVYFILAAAAMNIAKPWINLLWIPGLLFLRRKDLRSRHSPWFWMGIAAAACLGVTVLFTWYGRTFRFHYGVVDRMLGSSVQPLQQLLFCLRNPLRTAAVLWGTLFENDFFLPGLGNFGALDTLVPAISWLSVLLLAAGAFWCAHRRPLCAKTNAGLGLFCILYPLAAMMAMYITYTPVGMVRVIGLQARYFWPALPFLLVLTAQAFGWLQRKSGVVPAARPAGQSVSAAPLLIAGYTVGALGCLLLAQTYFIGPVTWTLAEAIL